MIVERRGGEREGRGREVERGVSCGHSTLDAMFYLTNMNSLDVDASMQAECLDIDVDTSRMVARPPARLHIDTSCRH